MSDNFFTRFNPFNTIDRAFEGLRSRPTAGSGLLIGGAAAATGAIGVGLRRLGTPQQILDSYNSMNAAQSTTPPLERLFPPLNLNRPIPSILRPNLNIP